MYNRKDDTFLVEQLSDFVEMTVLHIFNCILYNDKTNKYELDHLKIDSSEIYKFYSESEIKPFEVTSDVRKRWAKVRQGLNKHTDIEENSEYRPDVVAYERY